MYLNLCLLWDPSLLLKRVVFFLLLCSEYFYPLIFTLWWNTIAGSYNYIPELLLGIFDYSSHIRVLGVVCLRKTHGCISYKFNNLRSISQGCVGPKEMVSYKYYLSYQQVHDLYLPLAPSFLLVDALYQHQCFGLRKYFSHFWKFRENVFREKLSFVWK